MEQEKVQQIQFLEQNLRSISMQKRAFSMELSENDSAIKAINDSTDKIYKVIGQLMIVSDKDKTLEELEQKKSLIQTRIEALARQEEMIQKELLKLRGSPKEEKK